MKYLPKKKLRYDTNFEDDIKTLEKILWSDLGTKDEYEAEYGTSLSENLFVRSWDWI